MKHNTLVKFMCVKKEVKDASVELLAGLIEQLDVTRKLLEHPEILEKSHWVTVKKSLVNVVVSLKDIHDALKADDI